MFIKWFGHLGTLASLIGIIFLLKTENNSFSFFMGVLMCLAIVLFAISIYKEVKLYNSTKGIYCKDENEINAYMYRWINNRGIVTIFTRDMSWANKDQKMLELFRKKARNKELNIISDKNIGIISSLEKVGAKVYTYGELEYIPNSRFTLIRTGKTDSKVAIGKDKNGKHFIEEFGISDGDQFHIANDLVNFIKQFNYVHKKEKIT